MVAAEVGDPQPHERDATAYWYRRLATALALGNGAGVIALSSYVSNSKSLPAAAIVAYPALSAFLSGAICAFVSFVISLFWAALRIDAYSAHFEKLKKVNYPFIKEQIELRGLINVFVGILSLSQLAVILLGGWLFYAGSASVVEGLGEAACLSSPKLPFCEEPPLLFPRSDDNLTGASIQKALEAEQSVPAPEAGGIAIRTAAQFTAAIQYDDIDGGKGRVKAPARISLIDRNDVSPVQITRSTQSVRINVVAEPDVDLECQINIQNFYLGSGSPMLRNPFVDQVLKLNGASMGGHRILISLGVASFSLGKEHDYDELHLALDAPNQMQRVSITGPEQSVPTGLTYDGTRGGLMLVLLGKPMSKPCERIAKIVGFSVAN